jgi:hypothetical protein
LISHEDLATVHAGGAASKLWVSLTWRGLSQKLIFRLMATPTMDCLGKMVFGKVHAVTDTEMSQ